MVQEIGETRNKMANDLVARVEQIVNEMKDDKEPYYIVYHAKKDKFKPNTINAAIKMYREVPMGILGILVWYVDNSKGIFEFKPHLSSPPDVPVSPLILSSNESDFSPRVANQGKILQVVN